MVRYLDIELPEQEMYCPPLTIRVVDCRLFQMIIFQTIKQIVSEPLGVLLWLVPIPLATFTDFSIRRQEPRR